MAIARTPTVPKPAQKPAVVDEKKIEALISKGGTSTLAKETEAQQDDDAIKTVLLRTYESQVKEIDQLLLTFPKRTRPSRNAYIVQAIEERILRDKAKRK